MAGLGRGEPTSGGVAQLGERRLCKPEVIGSIPFASTTLPVCHWQTECAGGAFGGWVRSPLGRRAHRPRWVAWTGSGFGRSAADII